MSETDLLQTTDAKVWAQEFVRVFNEDPSKFIADNGEIDEDFMLGWFANAMCAAEDHAKRNVDAAIQQLIAAAGDAHSWLIMPWDHDDDDDQRRHAEIATALGDILAALPQALRETT